MMSMWLITFVGVVVVFLVLWVLAETIKFLGKYLKPPKPLLEAKSAVKEKSVPNVSESSVPGELWDDIVVITAVMKHQGVTGDLRITRFVNN